MFHFRSNQQRKAVFASRGKRGNFATRHPLVTGYGASAVAGLVGAALLKKPIGRVLRASSAQTSERTLARINRTARKLYPQLKGVKRVSSELANQMGGAAFTHPRMVKMGKLSILQRAARMSGHGAELDALNKELGRSPQIFVPPGKRAGSIGATAATYAHELGHGAYHTGRASRFKNIASGLSGVGTKEGTAILGSLAAHPLIARSNLSEKRKRQLHLIAGAVPLGAAAPMLADEALASYKGLKILKAAGASQRRMRNSRRLLGGAYSSYLNIAAPGGVFGGVTGHLYRKRSRQRERR